MLGFFLVIYSFVAFLIGMAVIATSTNILQEITAGILFIISAIFFTGAHIIGEIRASKTKYIELLTQIKDELRKLRLHKYPEEREVENAT